MVHSAYALGEKPFVRGGLNEEDIVSTEGFELVIPLFRPIELIDVEVSPATQYDGALASFLYSANRDPAHECTVAHNHGTPTDVDGRCACGDEVCDLLKNVAAVEGGAPLSKLLLFRCRDLEVAKYAIADLCRPIALRWEKCSTVGLEDWPIQALQEEWVIESLLGQLDCARHYRLFQLFLHTRLIQRLLVDDPISSDIIASYLQEPQVHVRLVVLSLDAKHSKRLRCLAGNILRLEIYLEVRNTSGLAVGLAGNRQRIVKNNIGLERIQTGSSVLRRLLHCSLLLLRYLLSGIAIKSCLRPCIENGSDVARLGGLHDLVVPLHFLDVAGVNRNEVVAPLLGRLLAGHVGIDFHLEPSLLQSIGKNEKGLEVPAATERPDNSSPRPGPPIASIPGAA
mmetsp:Transcript_79715/g.178595  ORF Transcript_79715/g.178595 Transcript_79715/m.178595 type:complete len:397 (-) Transcript_79715:124-1314(-)